MQSNDGNRCLKQVYYIEGSGLVPVPSARLSEVGKLKSEYHALEAKVAFTLASVRRA